MPKHLCVMCGQIAFNTYHEFEFHRALFHGMKTDIRPENITGRTPARIVFDAEDTWLKPYLIPLDQPLIVMANTQEHLEACRCNNCFNERLDALLASQQTVLEEVENA